MVKLLSSSKDCGIHLHNGVEPPPNFKLSPRFSPDSVEHYRSLRIGHSGLSGAFKVLCLRSNGFSSSHQSTCSGTKFPFERDRKPSPSMSTSFSTGDNFQCRFLSPLPIRILHERPGTDYLCCLRQGVLAVVQEMISLLESSFVCGPICGDDMQMNRLPMIKLDA